MTRSNQQTTSDQTMGNVSHTNPYTGETVGRLFSRGPTVVTDGGERVSSESRSDGNPAATDPQHSSDETMKTVDHTPPHGAEDANDVFERGREYDREPERGVDDV